MILQDTSVITESILTGTGIFQKTEDGGISKITQADRFKDKLNLLSFCIRQAMKFHQLVTVTLGLRYFLEGDLK